MWWNWANEVNTFAHTFIHFLVSAFSCFSTCQKRLLWQICYRWAKNCFLSFFFWNVVLSYKCYLSAQTGNFSFSMFLCSRTTWIIARTVWNSRVTSELRTVICLTGANVTKQVCRHFCIKNSSLFDNSPFLSLQCAISRFTVSSSVQTEHRLSVQNNHQMNHILCDPAATRAIFYLRWWCDFFENCRFASARWWLHTNFDTIHDFVTKNLTSWICRDFFLQFFQLSHHFCEGG